MKIFYIKFFLAKIFLFTKIFLPKFFHNIFANFFYIWCLRNNVFYEIFYSKFCLLRIFLFCNFGERKKNCKFFLLKCVYEIRTALVARPVAKMARVSHRCTCCKVPMASAVIVCSTATHTLTHSREPLTDLHYITWRRRSSFHAAPTRA